MVYAIGVDALRLLTAREFARSAEAATEAYHLAEKHGFPYWIAWSEIILAALQGPTDPERGRALLGAAIGRYEQTGARQLIPYARAFEAECYLNLDRTIEASAVLDRALALVEETNVRLYQAELLRLRACTAYRLDELNGDAHLAASLELASKQGARSFVLRTLITGFENAGERTRNVARNSLTNSVLETVGELETGDARAARRLLAYGAAALEDPTKAVRAGPIPEC
jgi:hypothetical protein